MRLPGHFDWNHLVKKEYIDGLMQERRYSFVNAQELHISCTNPPIWNHWFINPLAPGRWGCGFKLVILKLISRIYVLNISYDIILRWLPQDLTDD